MKKIVFSSVALFVFSMLWGFLVHGMILGAAYEASGLFRSLEDQQRLFPVMMLAHAMIAVGFTLIYRQGRGEKPWPGQGLRFGLLWALASLVPGYLIYHAVLPYELGMTLQQIGFDLVGLLLMGLLVAFLNKEAPAAAAA